MNPSDDDVALREAFERFAEAVRTGDLAAFEALCAVDVAPQRTVFERNSARVRERGWRLRLREIERAQDAAELRFELLDDDGAVIDHASVTFTREPAGWRIRSV